MRTWNDYKDYVKSSGEKDRREIEDCEELSRTISSAINGLYNFGFVGLTSLARKKERTVKSSE